MKSEPGRSTVSTSAVEGVAASAGFASVGAVALRRGVSEGDLDGAVVAPAGLATSAAVPAAAAFRKAPRSTESFFGLGMKNTPWLSLERLLPYRLSRTIQFEEIGRAHV